MTERIRKKRTSQIILFLALAGFSLPAFAQNVLPFPSPPMGGKVGDSMQESVHTWREAPRHLPEDAPNILIVMLDDAGFDQAPYPIEGTLKRLHFQNL